VSLSTLHDLIRAVQRTDWDMTSLSR
jgi:hypothetical protein